MRQHLGLARLRWALVLGHALAVSACHDQGGDFKNSLDLLPAPVALDSKLLFVDQSLHRGYLLDGKHESVDATRLDLPFGPSRALRRNKHDEALVLCDGRRSSPTAPAEAASLAAISGDGKLRSYDLGATPFDTIVQADDGRYALLFRTSTSSSRLLDNRGELAIVDLDDDKPSSKSVIHKTPASFGHTPTGAVFSPEMQIAGEARRLVVVLSAAEITLIDLAHLERRETVVQLSEQGGVIDPSQVLFSADDATLFVRGQSSDDIFMFRLEAYDNDALGNDFRPSINQLSGGQKPNDMALYGEAAARRLLVLSGFALEVLIVDPSSSKSTPVPLPSGASRILLFDSTTPKTPDVSSSHALLYDVGTSNVWFLDLDDVETRKTRNLEGLTLDSPIDDIIPLEGEDKVVIVHEQGVSVLDLAKRTIIPISSSAQLSHPLFDAKAARLWFAPPNQPYVDTLDLQDGSTREVLLDRDVEQLVPLFDSGEVAIVHRSDVGQVTLLDSHEPTRETAVSLRGFLVAGVLDRGEP